MTMTIKEAKALYLRASKAYFKDGSSELSDKDFDRLERTLQKEVPNWKPLNRTGAAVGKKVSVELAYPMPSLRKILHTDEGKLDRWVQSVGDRVYAMPKIDGNSVLITYSKGNFVSMVTRGNGEQGEDVTFLAEGMPQIPKTVATKSTMNLRCEIVMPAAAYTKKWKSEFDNPRNMTAGILNRRDLHPALKDLQIVILRDLNSPLSLVGGLREADKYFRSTKFNTVEVGEVHAKNLSSKRLAIMFKAMNGRVDYALDGIVLHTVQIVKGSTVDKPTYAVAWKLNEDKGVLVTVKRVDWKLSRYGVLVPRICFDKTMIQGVQVGFAAGNNAKWIKDRGIGVGSQIEVIRSGEVIPKIINVVKKVKVALPTEWEGRSLEWDEHGTHLLTSGQGSTASQSVATIQNFFKTLGCDHVGPAVAESMVYIGINTPYKAATISKANLGFLEGFSTRSVERLHAEIQEKVFGNPPSLTTLMVASAMFGKGVGRRMLGRIGSDDQRKLLKVQTPQALERLVESFNVNTPTKLALNSTWFKFKGSRLFKGVPHVIAADKQEGDGPVVVFTGYRDAEQAATLESMGYTIGSTLTSKTNFLLIKAGGKASSKLDKAEKMGVEVTTFAQLSKQKV